MKNQKQPHQQLTRKYNGLSATQEVLYQKEFKRADNAVKQSNRGKR